MKTPRNKKCANCSLNAIHEARERDCWVESACVNKRKYYQRRDKKLQDRANQYLIATGKPVPEPIELDSDGIFRAELILYGQQPNKEGLVNGGVNAIALNVYQGKDKVYYSEPLPTQGLLASDLEELIDRGMEQLAQKFNIKKLAKISWQNAKKKSS